jgi:hypothetical protein
MQSNGGQSDAAAGDLVLHCGETSWEQLQATDAEETLRLLMPWWQGGNNPAYDFGTRLAWLRPR